MRSLETNRLGDLRKIAVAGFCQTGRHPLLFAAAAPDPGGRGVVWRAAPREWEVTKVQPEPLDKIIAALPCPVFGAFGSDDHLISVPDVCRFRNSLESHNRSYEIHLYAGAPHGWLNDTMPGRLPEGAGRCRLVSTATLSEGGIRGRMGSRTGPLAF